MFFKLHNKTVSRVMIASYAKIPYAGNKLDVFASEYEAYNNVFNTMHYIKQEHYTTYFYSKNNSINYYRKSSKDAIIPIIDYFEQGTYQVFKLESKYDIKEEDSLLVRTEEGKYYVVTKGEYIVVLNVTDNKILYSVPVSNALYCNYFYPISNTIVPIVQITADGISITLCNLANDEVHTISWRLEHIRKIVLSILVAINVHHNVRDKKPNIMKYINELVDSIINNSNKNDKIDEVGNSIIKRAEQEIKQYGYEKIHRITFRGVYYMYDTNIYGLSHLKGIKIAFIINSLFLHIKVELKSKYIICYLDTKEGWWSNANYGRLTCNILFKGHNFFVRKYKFDGKVRNNYLSRFVYDSDCYYVRRDSCGIVYIKKGEYYTDDCELSAIYPYKNYWIIVNHWDANKTDRSKKMAIIDTKRRLMYIWRRPNEIPAFGYCFENYVEFYYYITISDKLIFLSHDLKCLSVINGAKIEDIFNARENSNCKKEKHRDIRELVKCFDVYDLLRQAILKKHKNVRSVQDVFVINRITHHMEKTSGQLYIISRYEIHKTVHIGLFALKILDNNVISTLLYDKIVRLHGKIVREHYIEFNWFEDKEKYTCSMGKIALYGLYGRVARAEKRMMNLDLMYSHGHVRSIKYNRASLIFGRLQNKYSYHEDIRCHARELHYTQDNLVVINYQCYKENDSRFSGHGKFCILLTEICIVREMSVVNV